MCERMITRLTDFTGTPYETHANASTSRTTQLGGKHYLNAAEEKENFVNCVAASSVYLTQSGDA